MPSSEQRCRGCGRAIPSGSDTCDDGEVCWECVARGEPTPPQAEVICPCGSPVPHCHCEAYPETHRHPGPPENAVPPVHHVHDTDGAEAGERHP